MIVRATQSIRNASRRQCCAHTSHRSYNSTLKVPDTRSPRPTTIPSSSSSSSSHSPRKLNVYRDVWPPVLSCLGIGLVAYYGLELWRTNLDYKYQLQDKTIEIEELKAQVESLRAENEHKATFTLSGKILGGRGSSSSSSDGSIEGQNSKKWFGLF